MRFELVRFGLGDRQVVEFSGGEPSLNVSLTVSVFEVLSKFRVCHIGVVLSKLCQSFGAGFLFVAEVVDQLFHDSCA